MEKSLTLFEGMQLSATCRKELEEAEGKVEILLKQNGKLQAEAFEPPRASLRVLLWSDTHTDASDFVFGTAYLGNRTTI